MPERHCVAMDSAPPKPFLRRERPRLKFQLAIPAQKTLRCRASGA
jgi:hypothetical protein